MNCNLDSASFLSNSECISNILPSWWMLNWSLDGSKERKRFCDQFKMNYSVMTELCQEVTQFFEEGKIGYPNVIFDKETAKYLYTKYFLNIPNIKLIGIGLHIDEAELFIKYNKPIGKNEGEMGIYQFLKRKVLMDSTNLLGYEILGYDLGIFHSYFCNHLEADLTKSLNNKPNKYGFFDSYECSLAISEFIDKYSEAEIALWQPWIVCEFSLVNG